MFDELARKEAVISNVNVDLFSRQNICRDLIILNESSRIYFKEVDQLNPYNINIEFKNFKCKHICVYT